MANDFKNANNNALKWVYPKVGGSLPYNTRYPYLFIDEWVNECMNISNNQISLTWVISEFKSFKFCQKQFHFVMEFPLDDW